jgi:hypothetical protein
MMAILALFYGEATADPWIKLVILSELMLYLVVTLGCLRAIFIVMPTDVNVSSRSVLNKRIMECIIRRNVYRFSLIATILITIAFLLTVATQAALRGLPQITW